MKTPEGLAMAVDCGVIQEVVRPLMSGKEAQVYVVVSDGTECVAKVYKEASQRTFKHRAQYTEGRRTRNSRDQRAINKRTRHGRSQDEAGWRNTEVDMIYRLRDAGVRVPEPVNFVDGVLVMELVKDAEGDPAPRLGDLTFQPKEARKIYQQLLREVTRMLCAGVIHGDLSDFNVLMAADGPVLIDFPQSLEAARNQGARKFLLRDVENLHRFVERYLPDEVTHPYGEEMWLLYEANRLEPETELRGDYRPPEGPAETGEVLALIEDADYDERLRREARGEEPRAAAPMRKVVDFTVEAKPPANAAKRRGRGRSDRASTSQGRTRDKPAAARSAAAPSKPSSATGDGAPKRKRSRRGRRSTGRSEAAGEAGAQQIARAGRKSDAGGGTQTARPGERDPAKNSRRGTRSRSRSDSTDPKRRSRSDSTDAKPRSRSRSDSTDAKPRGRSRSDSTEAKPRGRSRSDSAEAKPRGRSRSDSADATPRGRSRNDSAEATPRGRSRNEPVEGNSPGAAGEARRPARRRRRRPRRTGSREPT